MGLQRHVIASLASRLAELVPPQEVGPAEQPSSLEVPHTRILAHEPISNLQLDADVLFWNVEVAFRGLWATATS
ncbi:MAG: hypothetical protein OEV61_02380 [Chloroflexota bacterium]|nr:hypothetical protein [Chloroflexota bacterium]MDH5242373.1 hypothetical protein [Chloroflexota bacterium]